MDIHPDSDTCIFCRILHGEAPSAGIYRDDLVYAFMDINPINPGHCLVIPTRHCRDIYSLPEETAAAMMRLAPALTRAVKAEYQADGVNLWMANEPAAGQEVFHAHLHVIPRHVDDGVRVSMAPGPRPSVDELAQAARALASRMHCR